MLIPSRMPQHATLPAEWEPYDCVIPLVTAASSSAISLILLLALLRAAQSVGLVRWRLEQAACRGVGLGMDLTATDAEQSYGCAQ